MYKPEFVLGNDWFGWVGHYGISTIVGYLMPHPVLEIYDL